MLSKRYFKTKDEAEVTFEFNRPGATSVELFTDFNNWAPVAMKFDQKYKVFRTRIRLPKNGNFHFRYLVNKNEWENDDQADGYVTNSYGTQNCIVNTQE